jgi:hypothetical protein
MTRKSDHSIGDADCFVVMPFGGLFDRYYLNIFVPAIEAAGLRARRADSIFSSTSIMSDIWRGMRKAAVILADVTGKNSNVFYELGLAHASRKPVVIITGNLDDVPFDLKGLRVIEYNKDDENWGSVLKDRITSSLRATLTEPSLAVPTTFLENVVDPAFSTDPFLMQLRQIMDELRALRMSVSPRAHAGGVASRLMALLERHSNLLQDAPETARLEIFERLLRGDVSGAIETVQRSLDVSRIRAEEIAINIFDWMKLYTESRL